MSNCGTKRKGYKKGGYHRMPDGTMMKDSEHRGMKKGGSLKMVEKNGEQVPFYAADGVGKMAYGGKVKGMKEGGMCRGYGRARGNKPVRYS